MERNLSVTGHSSLRPEILYPLFAQTTTLPGIGPRLGKLVERIAGRSVVGLCWHLPTGLIDRRLSPKLADAPPGIVVTVTVTVDAHLPPPSRRLPYKVRCHDETAGLTLVFFHAHDEYLKRNLPVGEQRVLSGKLETYGGHLQMTHPDYIAKPEEMAQLQRVEPIYPLTAGLAPKLLGRAIQAAIARAPELPEWIEPSLLAKMKWPGWRTALWVAHNPTSEADLSPAARRAGALPMTSFWRTNLPSRWSGRQERRPIGRSIQGDGRLRAKVLAALPYSLTGAQAQALAEIDADMASPHRMLRLLQGDVGSGKTVVALLAMLDAVEAGAQAALHGAHRNPGAPASGDLGTARRGRRASRSRCSPAARKARRARPRFSALADGELAASSSAPMRCSRRTSRSRISRSPSIDEQHRFGVEQRVAARRQRPAFASPGDDGDAHPAHLDADRLWRSRRLAADGKAAGPQARRYPHRSRSSASTR